MNNFEHALEISRSYAKRGNCKKRNYGCVIIGPEGHIVSTGFTHSEVPCEKCNRWYVRSGVGYDACTSIHAEQDAIAGVFIPKGAIALLTCYDATTGNEVTDPRPCSTCMKLLKKAGVVKVITPTRVIEVSSGEVSR